MTIGVSLEPETVTFQNRVLNDGGEISDIKYVNSEIKRLKGLASGAGTAFDAIQIYCSLGFGFKRNSIDNTKVDKIYDLKSANLDLVAAGNDKPATLITGQNGKPGLLFNGTNHAYSTIQVPSMVQPHAMFFNFKPLIQDSEYYIDGRPAFDYCKIGLGSTSLQAYAGGDFISAPGVPVSNFSKSYALFNGASSSYRAYTQTATGAHAARNMEGVVLGRPGGVYAPSNHNANYEFYDVLIFGVVPDAGLISSTDSVYNNRYN